MLTWSSWLLERLEREDVGRAMVGASGDCVRAESLLLFSVLLLPRFFNADGRLKR